MEHTRYEINIEDSTPFYGRIAIEPLERGYGVTLGNALRRVLLSSIKGAAITAVRVDGVLHEFTTVPGVKEDVIELIMNIKHIPVRCHVDEYKIVNLTVEPADEARVIKARDIAPDSEVEFPDPEAVVCHLEAGAKLQMELYVECGTGYATFDRPRPNYLPIDALVIDAIFSPARRVKYEVSDKRAGQRTDYDRLVLEIWTNGVISPEDAIREASAILKDYFLSIAIAMAPNDPEVVAKLENDEDPRQRNNDGSSFKDTSDNPVFSRPVKDLELSVRSENCLMRGGVSYIGDLVNRKRSDLLKIRNLGKISLNEIEEKLMKFGLELTGEIEDEHDDIER